MKLDLIDKTGLVLSIIAVVDNKWSCYLPDTLLPVSLYDVSIYEHGICVGYLRYKTIESLKKYNLVGMR